MADIPLFVGVNARQTAYVRAKLAGELNKPRAPGSPRPEYWRQKGSGKAKPDKNGPFTVRGAADINKVLSTLAFKEGKAVLRSVMRAAIKPVMPRALQLTPVGMTSTAISSIKIFSSDNKSRTKVKVQVSSSKARFRGKPFYFPAIELGLKTRKRKAVSPLRRAHVENEGRMSAYVKANIGKAVERKVKALARKAAKAKGV